MKNSHFNRTLQYKISLKRPGNHDGNRSRQFCSRELVSVPEPWNSYLLMWFGCWLTKWRLMRYRCDNLLVLPCWSRLTKKHSLTTTSDWFINGRYDHWPFTLFLIIRVTFLSCGIFFSWKQFHCLWSPPNSIHIFWRFGEFKHSGRSDTNIEENLY